MNPKTLKIAIAQINVTVGDLQHNYEKHKQAAIYARDILKADIIVFPELGLTGYSPQDLLFRSSFIKDTNYYLNRFISSIEGIYCIVGHPHLQDQQLFNAASIFYNNQLVGRYYKHLLPNYDVFDERRYFTSGTEPCVIEINHIPVGIAICEDLWAPVPAMTAKAKGAQYLICLNASPFDNIKHEKRLQVLKARAIENQLPIVYVNMVGAQDELIFDGGSMLINDQGKIDQFAGFFNEIIFPITISQSGRKIVTTAIPFKLPNQLETIYQALVIATRDYIEKNNFQRVVLGISGGIDSALCLAIAVDAIGADRVHGLMMPSRYTAEISNTDAELLLKNLNVTFDIISIENAFEAFLKSLHPLFKGSKPDITEENLQARCRAILLMAYSNKFGSLVLTTGNRSELAVGYCTLYGDMAGGFAVLKDVPKTLIYELANYRNKIQPVIPERIITRPPSAELAFDQKDEDSLPPYVILDQIISLYINEEKDIGEIIQLGFDEKTVNKVVGLIRRNEYKRQQGAIGPRIHLKAFGKDRRYPITNGYKG